MKKPSAQQLQLLDSITNDKEFNHGEKRLYKELLFISQAHGFCYGSNAYFAKKFGVDVRTISRWLSHLTKKGLLKLDISYKRKWKRHIFVNEKRLEEPVPISDKIIDIRDFFDEESKKSSRQLEKEAFVLLNSNKEVVDKNEGVVDKSVVHKRSANLSASSYEEAITSPKVASFQKKRFRTICKEQEAKKKEETEALFAFCQYKGIPFELVQLRIWHHKFGYDKLNRNMNLLFEKFEKGQVKTPDKWMEAALRDDYAFGLENIAVNRQFFEENLPEYMSKQFVITEKYATCDERSIDFQFTLNPALFQEMVMRFFETQQQYEAYA